MDNGTQNLILLKLCHVRNAENTAFPTGLLLCTKSAHSTCALYLPKIMMAILQSYFSGKIKVKRSGGKYDERKNFNRKTNSGICCISQK